MWSGWVKKHDNQSKIGASSDFSFNNMTQASSPDYAMAATDYNLFAHAGCKIPHRKKIEIGGEDAYGVSEDR